MDIAVDWDVKHQFKQTNNILVVLGVVTRQNRPLVMIKLRYTDKDVLNISLHVFIE